MTRPIITLTTDFGEGSPYIAQMKGVIFSINSAAEVIDLTHAIRPQDIHQAARTIPDVTCRFPDDSIHLVVVDPGVGTDRRIIYACIANRHYVAPDNGCLTGLARRDRPSTIVEVVESKFWLETVSSTFHGRDIMAPVAARISLGLDPLLLGPRRDRLFEIKCPEVRVLPGKIEGEIVAIDSFGNLVTNITKEMLADAPHDESVSVRCDEHETLGIYATYGDQPEMTLIALIGSSDQLELAIVGDSAKMMLGVGEGEKVTILW